MIPEALKVSEGPLLPCPRVIWEPLSFFSFPSAWHRGRATHGWQPSDKSISCRSPQGWLGLLHSVTFSGGGPPGAHARSASPSSLNPYPESGTCQPESRNQAGKISIHPNLQGRRLASATSPNSRDSLSQEGLPLV